jgi:hypothetical protein
VNKSGSDTSTQHEGRENREGEGGRKKRKKENKIKKKLYYLLCNYCLKHLLLSNITHSCSKCMQGCIIA